MNIIHYIYILYNYYNNILSYMDNNIIIYLYIYITMNVYKIYTFSIS